MIICEIGQNHCGDMNLAKYLIELAKGSGADLVKFQLYDHKILYADHPEIPNVELTYAHAKMLFDHGEKIGIEVFFSVFDVERVKWCEEIGVKRYKVAYSQNRNLELAYSLSKIGKQVIISASTKQVANSAFGVNTDWKVLYCVSHYPALLKELDELRHFPVYGLSDIKCSDGAYRGGFLSYYDGFSDHTIGLDAAKIALARGAEIIEKHFAINHHTGIDAPWSMTPDKLRELKEWENKVKEVLCQKELVKS